KKTNLPLPKSRCHPKLQKKRRIVRTILIFKKKIKKKLTCRCRNPVAIRNYKKKEESLERFLYLKKNQKKTNLPLPKSRCHTKLQKKKKKKRTNLKFKKKIKKKKKKK